MPSVALAEIAGFLDEYLAVPGFPDYPNALNGVQVESSGPIRRVAAAVDASQAVIDEAKDWADLLIVHHGLFWGGLQPLTGRHFDRVKALIGTNTALYSAHLPLDAHAEVGNSAVLARKLGWAREEDDTCRACDRLIDGLQKLNDTVEIPGLRDCGISTTALTGALDKMAGDALASGSPQNNPRVPTAEEIKSLYLEAY